MKAPRLLIRTLALAGSALAATAAGAHIVFAQPTAVAGSYHAGFLRVAHGCAGSPTVAVTVRIPEGVTAARPQPKPGWTLSIDRAPLAVPIRGEGGEVRERVTAITWTGTLPADEFDQFGLMLKLPPTPGALYFPTVQRCAQGSIEWTTIPAPGQSWHMVKTPAPVIELTAPAAAAAPAMPM